MKWLRRLLRGGREGVGRSEQVSRGAEVADGAGVESRWNTEY